MGGYFEKHALVQSDGLWAVRRFEYTAGEPIYIGRNKTHKAATDSLQWHVWKISYTGTDATLIEGPLTGTWDGRDSMDWE